MTDHFRTFIATRPAGVHVFRNTTYVVRHGTESIHFRPIDKRRWTKCKPLIPIGT